VELVGKYGGKTKVLESWLLLLMSAVSCWQKVAKQHGIMHDGDMSVKCQHHVSYVELVGKYGGKTKASVKLVCQQHVDVMETCQCRQKSVTFSCQHVADIIQPRS
jgi:hypothetical protein